VNGECPAGWYNFKNITLLPFVFFPPFLCEGLQTQYPIARLAHLTVQAVQEQQTEQVAQLLIDMPVVPSETPYHTAYTLSMSWHAA